MKKYARLLFASFVLTPLIVTGVAVAETTTASPPATTTTTTTLNAQQKADLQKRLTDRKAAYKTAVTAAEQLKIKNKCTTSQTVITTLGTRIKGVDTTRGGIYTTLVTDLTKLSTKLKAKGLDTTTLNDQIATLKTQTATFKTDITSYQQSLSDLKDMDCVADPTAFKASLENARTLRTKVATDAVDIRGYATGTIQPTLKTLRAELVTKTSSSTTGEE